MREIDTTASNSPSHLEERIKSLENQIEESQRLKKRLEERLQFETLLSEISSVCSSLSSSELDRHIEDSLHRIGTFLKADRCTLAQFATKKKEVRFIHSWEIEGTAPMSKVFLETREFFPWSIDQLKAGKLFIFRTPDDLPDEAAVDKKSYHFLSVQSHASVPIEIGGDIVGALSVSVSSGQRSWPEAKIQRLRLIGEIFANALVRRQNEQDIRRAFNEIQQLKEQLEADCSYLREEIDTEYNAHNMIGQSDAMRQVFLKIEQIAPTDITVLVCGETGTGKELVARAIHTASRRSDRPMVKVNCAALPASLIESELFGHEKGAFTSAEQRRVGRFELADGNSLFLDEVGELPMESQAKLLRVLQDGEFERLGCSKTIKVDVRIITATNRDLAEEVKKGRFRQDLWYRLNVFPIPVPPLRERGDDITLLANAFVDRFNRKLGKSIVRIPTAVLKALQRYDWPGNVRELENVVERAVISTTGSSLQLLDPLTTQAMPLATGTSAAPIATLRQLERDHIIRVLDRVNWRVDGPKGAALILDINPSTLRTRMRKLGIKKSITAKG